MKKTIEQMVCQAILQEPVHVKVGEREYAVAPPVASTLIEVSKYISMLPQIPVSQDAVQSALAYACDCEFTADVVAILMLGRRNLRTEKVVERRRLGGLLTTKETIEVDNQKELAQTLLDELSWREISELGREILSKMDVGFFLGFTNSLLEINLLRATKTTASGQL